MNHQRVEIAAKGMAIFFALVLASLPGYAKNCTKGKPCGNTCISVTYTCHIDVYTPPAVRLVAPVAAFALSTASGPAPLSATMDPAASYATNGTIVTYQWRTSNGQTSTDRNANFIFQTPGNYTVTLTVTDNYGQPSTTERSLTVTAPVAPTTLLIDPNSCLFDWAERTYPALFNAAGAPTLFWGPYTYRYYFHTDSYLAISSTDDHVYYLGIYSGNAISDLGALSTWLTTAGCQ